MARWSKAVPAALAVLAIVGCGVGSGSSADVNAAQGPDYGATKQMVVDILHSSEGRQAIEEILKDPSLKQKLIVSETDVSKAVEKTLESSKSQSFLTEQAKDPKFAQALAKATQPEMLQLIKQSMKDPEFQTDMLVLLKSPDFTKSLQTLFKTPEYRSDVMKIMTEALNTPTFRLQFQDALKKTVAEEMQQAGGSQKGGKPSSDKSQSGSGGGGGGDSQSGSGGSSSDGGG